ncbi:MAG: DUF2079 domain-containing protein [Vulcanimicrobiaceae bacterium]
MTDRTALRTIYGACAAVGIALFACACVRFAEWTYGADTGTFYQVVLHAFSGMRDGPEHGTHWRFHCSPTLVVLWPILAAIPSQLTLQTIAIAAILACPPLVYALARTRLSSEISLRLALLTLLYPPLLSIAFEEFHELALFPALLLGSAIALYRRRYGWYALFAALAIGVREDICLELAVITLGLGMYWVASDRARSICAFGTAAASLAVLGIYYGIIIPHIGGWRPSHFYVYPFASSPLALLAAFVTAPAEVIRATVTFGRFTYLLEAFVPLLGLPFRSPALLLALPGFGIVLLANSGEVWRMGEHYAALWIPFVLLAAILACQQLARRRPAAVIRWLNGCIAVCALALIVTDPMHPVHYLRPVYNDLADVRRALTCIPHDAGVDTHEEWYSAIVATYPGATINDLSQPYALFATNFPNRQFATKIAPQIAALVSRGKLVPLCTYGKVAVYRRPSARPN